MKIKFANGKWRVAIDGRFVAAFDTEQEAKEYNPDEIKPLPVEEPEDVNFGQSYESYS